MNLFILLLFGVLSTSYGIYKIPEYDPCVLRVLLCDDFTKPLTPVDNSTLEMFETIEELNAVCDELSNFRICLKDVELFCKKYPALDVGIKLLDNRRLAFDLCVRASSHQHVYMMVEGCVNKYSHSAIEFCTDKTVAKIGLDFDVGDIDAECRYLGELQHCHIAVVTAKCGNIAGNMLEKLVIFRGERDFMCIGYEKQRLGNIEEYYATMDSYVQQYRDKNDRLETEDKSERIGASKKDFKTQEGFGQDQASSKFQSRISPITDKDKALGNMYMSDREQPINSETFHRNEPRPLHSLSNQEIDSTTTPPNIYQCTRLIYDKVTDNFLSYENNACKMKASFLLLEVRQNVKFYRLKCGEANVLWSTSSPMKAIFCAWIVDPARPQILVPCSVLIGPSMLAEEFCQLNEEHDPPLNATIAIYELINNREAKRVAEMRVRRIGKFSSIDESILKSFKTQAHDIRYWCTKQHEANKYKEPNRIHSKNRIGLMSSDVNKHDIVNGESRIIDQKYNFYAAEKAKYPTDTEIHLISSEDRNFEDEFEDDDTNISPNYYENLNPFSDEKGDAKNLEPFTLLPSKSSSQYLYRPYELYRPRLGEVLKFQDQSMEDGLGIKDAEKGNPKILSFEDVIEDDYLTRLNAAEICPVLQENISELDDKLFRYSKENYMNIADSLDMMESENYKKFLICKNFFPFCNEMWKDEMPQNINIDNQENKYEEIYVVTPSAEIEIHEGPESTMFEDSEVQNLDEDSEVQNLDEDSQIFNTADDSEDLVKVPQDSYAKTLTLEKDLTTKSTNPRSSKVYFLELMPNYQTNQHPFSYNLVDASTNNEEAYEDFSVKSENMFNRRSNQKYPTNIEGILLNAFEVLAEVKINVRRMSKILRETRMEKNTKVSPKRIEL